MPSQSIRIVAEVTAHPGRSEELWQNLAELVEPTRKETGNISYDILQDLDNPDHFLFYEEWESRDYFERHLESPHVADYDRATRHLISIPVRISVCTLRTDVKA
ncbi:putative quinol monooxygenase [Streptomyces griseorubiginosus]|uniref:putative quinol monooxygenase n=1 Tax=Streptomyces griseorubiginosus TaxID=67304 RepID=UPI00368C7C6A